MVIMPLKGQKLFYELVGYVFLLRNIRYIIML